MVNANKIENRAVDAGHSNRQRRGNCLRPEEGDRVVVSDRSGLKTGQPVQPQVVDAKQYQGNDSSKARSHATLFDSQSLLHRCLCLALAVIGITALTQMPVDLFPPINLPEVIVATFYNGMPPGDIETDITNPLERFFTLASGSTTRSRAPCWASASSKSISSREPTPTRM